MNSCGMKALKAALIVALLTVSRSYAFEFVLEKADFWVPPVRASVVGDFNDWNPEAAPLAEIDEGWGMEVPLEDGAYQYKFFAVFPDGTESWIVDPNHAVYIADGNGNVNNYLVLEQGRRRVPDGLEVFEWESPEAENVVVAGDFNWWRQGDVPLRKDPDGVWRCRMKIERPFAYKFIVNDLWKVETAREGVEYRIDSFGGRNNLRPVLGLEDPEDWLAASDGDLTAGLAVDFSDPNAALAKARELSGRGEYARAAALCRRVEQMHEGHIGALYTEAEIQRKHGFEARAAECWDKLIASNPDDPSSRQAYMELAKYRLFIEQDAARARSLYKTLLDRTDDAREQAAILYDISTCYRNEHNWAGSLATLREAFAVAPPPDGSDNDWAHLWTEMLLGRGLSHWKLGELEAAVADFETVIAVSPWPNSQNVQVARRWSDQVKASPEYEKYKASYMKPVEN